MSAPHPEVEHGSQPDAEPRTRGDVSIGELVDDITSDLTHLVRGEIQLAKAELKEEAGEAGKAAGLYGGSGYAAGIALLLASLAAVFGLGHVMDLAWAALVMAGVWAVIGTALYLTGRKRMRTVHLAPERSIGSLKEDAKWARHPTS